MSKRILVTGGAGFLGNNLCRRLLREGHEVLCVDNFYTSRKEQGFYELQTHPNFEFLRHDITFPLYVEVDEIYNLACPASPIHYQRDPVQTVKTNVMGMINVLGLAKRTGSRVLQASTSEVYGDPLVHPQVESYWGNTNPIGHRACFSADTEILTRRGWKLLSDVSYYDEVATLNRTTEGLEYQMPTEIIKERYIGDLLHFANYQCDLLVTPNHQMYVGARGKPFQLRPAYDAINWNRATMKKTAHYDGKEVDWFYFPLDIDVENTKVPVIDKIDMDDWLEFFGYYITKGNTYIQKRNRVVNGEVYENNEYRVLIAQSQEKHPENYEKIRRCIERIGWNYTEIDHQFQICNKQLANYLLRFGKSHEKYLPYELLQVSKRQLRILADALLLGDGSADGTTYYSSSYTLISNFQEILLKLGLAGNIATHDKRKPRPVYQIHILGYTKPGFLTPTYSHRKSVRYNGYVHCVSVPNRVIFVRRNGKALFCGNCYDEGKRCAETLCFDYLRQHGVDVRVVRIFNTFGPHLAPDDGRVISNFIMQALRGEPITVYGDGSQTRSFCYVDDLIEGFVSLMAREENPQTPVNLGNPEEWKIKEVAGLVLERINPSGRVEYRDLPKDDPIRRRPDITLAKSLLGWEPQTPFCLGLGRTIDYFSGVQQ